VSWIDLISIADITGPAGTTDHGLLLGLGDDDHTQYMLLSGRVSGQTLIGGTAASENLTLSSTGNATKGKILFGTSAYDEVNNRLGIGTATPTIQLQVESNANSSQGMFVRNLNTGTSAISFISATSDGGTFAINMHSQAHGSWPDRATIGTNSLVSNGLTLITGTTAPIELWTNNNRAMTIASGGNVGIGTNTPTVARLEVVGASLTGSAATGILNLTQTWNTTGNPTAILLNVANTASGTTANLIDLQVTGVSRFRVNKNGRISQTITGSTSTTILGEGAGGSASLSGSHCVFIGALAGQVNTTASANTFIGSGAGAGATTGGSNIYIGRDAGGTNQTSSLNTAIGVFAMLNHNTGTHNISIGFNTARHLADGVTSATSFSSCVYLGNDIRVTSSGVDNEIIIGKSAIGNGSNTVTLGNLSITNTYLRGNINLTDSANIVIDTTTGTKIGTSTSQKIGLWNATPIVQPTTAVAAAAFVANSGPNIHQSSTFDGYTVEQVVKALRNIGILA
jgi:hypothetical protein